MNRNVGAERNYLIGAITVLQSDQPNSLVEICLEEPLKKHPSSLVGQSKAHLNQPPIHLIRLIGTWSRLVIEVLKLASELKLYLDVYEPQFNTDHSWDFHDGIRAELLIANPDDADQAAWFIKTIDMRSHLSSHLSLRSPQPGPVHNQAHASPTTYFESMLQPTSHERRETRGLPGSRMKRSLAVEDLWAEDSTFDHNRPALSENQYTPCPNKRVRVGSGELSPHGSHPRGDSRRLHTSTLLFSTPDALTRPDSFRFNTQPAVRLRTLDEITQMQGGPSEPFNVIAIIDQRQTDKCYQVAGGAADYKMTVYLTDFSRPMGSKNVTCNLFWKTEEECAAWEKQDCDWKVIFLSNVHKRPVNHYPDQIIGISTCFQYALWCPGEFYSSKPVLEQFSSLFGSTFNDLLAKALALYQQLKQRSAPQLLPRAPTPPVQSVLKTISELKLDHLGEKFDLCVEIVDIWVADKGNDRMTVTDYTLNPALRMREPANLFSSLTLPVPRFHQEHGGTSSNWGVTANRLMSVYLEPSVLRAIYRQFDQSDATKVPSMYDYRYKLLAQVVGLKQLDLHPNEDNSDINFYATMAADSTDSLAVLTDRIVPLSPSEPAFQKLLNDKEIYRQDMREYA
ncbi:hypothetical protein PtB15_1B865 [Puccinia triticina]|nr:hypothetical protein PtB15_1B865 [Puccinia triticina]